MIPEELERYKDILNAKDGRTTALQQLSPSHKAGCTGHWKTHASRDLSA
jgi:hypothetical protein